MRRWYPLASNTSGQAPTGPTPDDPGIWGDISNMWPVPAGGYAVCDVYGSMTATTATGATIVAPIYAFAAETPTASVGYVVQGGKLWEIGASASSATDRTNGVTVSSTPYMAQYGNVNICVMGNAGTTVSATAGGNFSALAGAPKANIVLVCSNAVLMFNTDSSGDGWAASDVGDYTNWTTGESASGRFLDTPGQVLGAVVYNGSVYAFKESSIYRGQYVGGLVKWAWQLINRRWGLGSSQTVTKALVTVSNGIVFSPSPRVNQNIPRQLFFFDTLSQPVALNWGWELGAYDGNFTLTYDPAADRVCVSNVSSGTPDQIYCELGSRRFGVASGPTAGAIVEGLQADVFKHYATHPTRPLYWTSAVNTMTLHIPQLPETTTTAFSAYVTTGRVGDGNPENVSNFTRVTPLLRRRIANPNNAASMTCVTTTSSERYGGNETASAAINEATNKNRFDFALTAPFARFQIFFSNTAAEIDDVIVKSAPGGTV